VPEDGLGLAPLRREGSGGFEVMAGMGGSIRVLSLGSKLIESRDQSRPASSASAAASWASSSRRTEKGDSS